MKPALLLLTGTRSPTATRMALALLQQGCRVDVLCPVGHTVLQVPGLARCWHFAMRDSLDSLRHVLGSGRGYRMILPCDAAVVAQLITLHEQVPALRGLIEQSIGPAACHETLLQRHRLLMAARSLGLDVPEHRHLDSAQDLLFWFREGHGRSVLKRDLSPGEARVQLVNDLSEAERAWASFSRPVSASGLLRGMLVERDPLVWWSRRHPGRTRVLVQRFVEGRPVSTLMLCEQGRLLACLSLAVVETLGPTGPAVTVHRIRHPGMEAAARQLSDHLHLTGLHSLGFVLEQGSGRPCLIDFNPHCAPTTHLAWADQPSLAALLAARLRGHPPLPVRHPFGQDRVSLFPQVPQGQALGEHDVPGGQPVLVQAMADRPWPQRLWSHRLHARLHPSRPVERIRYDDELPEGRWEDPSADPDPGGAT